MLCVIRRGAHGADCSAGLDSADRSDSVYQELTSPATAASPAGQQGVNITTAHGDALTSSLAQNRQTFWLRIRRLLTCSCCCSSVISAIRVSLVWLVCSTSLRWADRRKRTSFSLPSNWLFLSFYRWRTSIRKPSLLVDFFCYQFEMMCDCVWVCWCLITRASSSNSRVFFLALSSMILSCSLFLWVRSSCRRWRSHSSCRWRSSSRLAAWTFVKACVCKKTVWLRGKEHIYIWQKKHL